MRALHPSETAGDGKPIEKAQYNFPTDRPDHHRRCAMCGFQFDDDANQKGDSLLTPGIQYSAVQSQTVNLRVPAGAAPISFTDQFVEPTVVSGCPFCGTYNPEGKYVGDPFDSGVDIANL